VMAREKLLSLKSRFNKRLYTYRYDLLSLFFMELVILWIIVPLFYSGHIVFSDIDFPINSKRYLEEIFGLWNSRWNTATMLNIPRLLFILPSWLVSALFGFSGELFFKLFLFSILQIAALSMYLFCKRLVSVYISPHFNLFMTLSVTGGALLYTINPWVIVRIQHIYLLCGYALFPLMLMFFFNAFDPRFQTQLIRKYSLHRIRLYRRNIIDLMLLSLTVAVMSAAIHYLFYSVIIIIVFALLLYLKLYIIHFRTDRIIKRAILINFLLKGLIFGLFLVLFSYYWMGAYAGSIIIDAGASQNNINVLDTLSLFSRNSSIVNVLLLISYWWPMFDLATLPITFYMGGFLILTIIIAGGARYAWKNHIILLFTFITSIFIVLATGVKNEFLAVFFVNVVTKIPVFGTIFRDPNKLVGLASAGYSILMVFGLYFIFSHIEKRSANSSILIIILALVVSVSFWFFIEPFRNHFIKGFYAPIAIPKEYDRVQTALAESEQADGRVLYLPVSENMIQPGVGIATPFWNKNPERQGYEKATGDFHIYSSDRDTIFHHEGNPPSLTYYINFLHNILDKGLVNNIAEYIRPMGVNELVYHDEYLGQEGRQDFHLRVLDFQNNLNKFYTDDIFTLYRLDDPLVFPAVIDKAIHTPYGLSHLSAYMRMPDFDFAASGIIFSSLQKNSYIDKVRPGDLIEAADYNDLWLSNLPQELYISPFEFINEGNPFLGWAKTFIHTNDWLWYLRSQNIDNFPYDFAFGSGVAVTFASARLDVPVYSRENITGKNILDFNSMLRLDLFFKADNPHLFQITANPIGPRNKVPLLHGEIIQGDPGSIWQVARSGLIDAAENTPYQFKILLSGRGTNKIHVKVRFFDEDMNELGITYVVAPRERPSFDAMNLYSEYISPPGSCYMRLELQSYQRPEQKVYWWIHDINIIDLGDFKAANTFDVEYIADKTESHSVYMRVFKSGKGGNLSIRNGDTVRKINTEDAYLNQFQWITLGQFDLKQGTNSFIIENLSAFNAVNVLAVIPDSMKDKYQFPVQRALDRGRVFFALEAENDFSYQGNIQSDRRQPHFSMGNAVASQTGVLSRRINILKNASYDLRVNLQGIPDSNKLHIEFRQPDGFLYASRLIALSSAGTPLPSHDVINYIPAELNGDYVRDNITLSGGNQFIQKAEIRKIPLAAGAYDLVLQFESNAESLSSAAELHYFNPAEVKIPSYIADIFQEDCSDCESITEDMVHKEIEEGVLALTFEPTCSCDWFVFSSQKIAVETNMEYLVIFEGRSEGIRKRHSKVVFLDEQQQIINTDFIPEVDEADKSDWNRYEHIVTAPDGAVKMLFQVWARGSKSHDGLFEMKNYEILRHGDLLKVDSLTLIEDEKAENRITQNIHPVEHAAVDSMLSRIRIPNSDNNEELIAFSRPAIPLWHLETSEDDQRSDLQLNAVSTAFFTRGDGEAQFKMRFRKHYYAGLIIFLTGFIAARLFYNRLASPVLFTASLRQVLIKLFRFIKRK